LSESQLTESTNLNMSFSFETALPAGRFMAFIIHQPTSLAENRGYYFYLCLISVLKNNS